MAFDQGEFDFDRPGTEDGYRNWQAELDRRKREFENRWGVILGRAVRVKLWDRDDPLVGVLHLMTEPAPGKVETKGLVFSVNGKSFRFREIESIVREDVGG